MTAYPDQTLTRTMLGQLCSVLRDSQSRPLVIQPGFEPGSVVTPLALETQCLRPLRNSGETRHVTQSVHSLWVEDRRGTCNYLSCSWLIGESNHLYFTNVGLYSLFLAPFFLPRVILPSPRSQISCQLPFSHYSNVYSSSKTDLIQSFVLLERLGQDNYIC